MPEHSYYCSSINIIDSTFNYVCSVPAQENIPNLVFSLIPIIFITDIWRHCSGSVTWLNMKPKNPRAGCCLTRSWQSVRLGPILLLATSLVLSKCVLKFKSNNIRYYSSSPPNYTAQHWKPQLSGSHIYITVNGRSQCCNTTCRCYIKNFLSILLNKDRAGFSVCCVYRAVRDEEQISVCTAWPMMNDTTDYLGQ